MTDAAEPALVHRFLKEQFVHYPYNGQQQQHPFRGEEGAAGISCCTWIIADTIFYFKVLPSLKRDLDQKPSYLELLGSFTHKLMFNPQQME